MSERRGAALVEAAIVTGVFVTLVCGMIDLGLALFLRHVVTQAARQGARAAVVHGALAPQSSAMNAWGPLPTYPPLTTTGSLYAGSTSHSVQADQASDELAAAVAPSLVGLHPSTVTVQITWPDGDNGRGHRVTVSVTAPYRHPIGFLYGAGSMTIGATSTMTILH